MRLDDYRESDNVGDQRGQSFGGGGGFGGGGMGMLLGLVASRFGIGGIIVVGLGMMLLGFNPLSLVGGGGTAVAPHQQVAQSTSGGSAQACAVDAASTFSCRVLASTEDTWGRIFEQQGRKYVPPKLIFYSGRGQSGCGAAQSAMGPFYCPNDNDIYLDTSFYGELQNRFGAAGDFAQAYVVAHEVGHHIQYLLGIADKVREAQARVSESEGNAIQVKMELQADCYAGVWAANNRERIEPGDVQEGLRAAKSIGDDTLQQSAGQTPVPDSFTHGTSQQRQFWLKRGLDTGDLAQCDTFSGEA